jgi:hypothetical protein
VCTLPRSYGGLELAVANLARERSKRDYDVTVFAAENSTIDGVKAMSLGKEMGTTQFDWLAAEKKEAFANLRDVPKGFDVVNGHTWYGFYYSHLGHDPTCFPVMHTHTPTPRRAKLVPLGHSSFPKALRTAKFCLVAISKWMQRVYKDAIVKMPDNSEVPLGFDSAVVFEAN